MDTIFNGRSRSSGWLIDPLWIFGIIMALYTLPATSGAQQIFHPAFTVSGDSILVTYDLAANPDDELTVSLTLRMESVPGFRIIPATVSGDIGTGKFGGRNRKIIWLASRDFAIDPNVDDYYFEIHWATVSGGGIPWYYYVGGGTVVAGAAAWLILGPHDGGRTKHTSTFYIGAPPPRP